MSYDYGYCMSCPERLCILDDDPNGAHNATCARCRAMEEHDFDVEPNAVFNRAGHMITEDSRPVGGRALTATLKAPLKSIEQQPQRQDSTNDQLHDLRIFANRLGLYDAADVIGKLMDQSLYTCGKCRKTHSTFNSASCCCLADHVECPLADLPRDAEVGHGLAYNYAKGTFSNSWEIVKNSRLGSDKAVPVYPLTPLMCQTMSLLAENSKAAGEAALKDAINRLLNER